MNPREAIDLLDWKRRIFRLYDDIRQSKDPEEAWGRWRAARDRMFRHHPQSPIPAAERSTFTTLDYFPYEPALRVLAEMRDARPQRYDIPTSGEGAMTFTRIAEVHFEFDGRDLSLEVYWLDAYGGGLFLPFRDATSGRTSYGAGRYLLDTVKGADLGTRDDRLVLDFNFAYNPSCAYDPTWVCPLAPPANRLDIAIEAGERS